MSLKYPAIGCISFGELDQQINDLLRQASISFYKKEAEITQKGLEGSITAFQEEFVSRNIFTIGQIQQYCINPLAEILRGVPPEKMSDEYMFLLIMLGGYAEGMKIVSQQDHSQTVKQKPEHFLVITTLFSETILEQIKDAVQKTLTEFLEEVKNCHVDIRKDTSIQDKQMDILRDFAESIRTKQPDAALKEIAGKVVHSDMMDFYWKTKSQDVFGTPCERLLTTMDKMILYWDILHQAGYRDISTNKDSNTFDWMQMWP
jgi:hypothetical protein